MDEVYAEPLRRSSGSMRADSDAGAPGMPHALARLSRSELCARLEAQSGDLADLRGLVTPFKVENVRLSRSLKRSRQQIQEVLQALRDFFADPTRREWFRERKDDVALCGFFQRLIAWYRSVCEEDNPTIAFYQKVWEYERGDDFRMAESSAPDSASEAPSEARSADAGPPSSARASSSAGSSSMRPVDASRPSSSTLYDACRERTENLRLQEENARLRQENASLHRANASLEKEIQGMSVSPDALGGSGSAARPAPGRQQARPRPKPVRTLAKLSAGDARWERLLRDPDKLFSPDDIIDDTYEQYLSEVLSIMEKHDYSFKRAIEISETSTSAGDGASAQSGDSAVASGPHIPGGPAVQGLGPQSRNQGLGAGVSPELMQQGGSGRAGGQYVPPSRGSASRGGATSGRR